MLTDSSLRSLKPNGTRQAPIADKGGAPGLYIAPMPCVLAWYFRFTSPETGKRSVMSFGTYPDMSLTLARTEAEKLAAKVRRGTDPLLERERQREQIASLPTLATVVERWDAARAEGSFGKVPNERTRAQARRRLGMYILPLLGDRLLFTIQPADLSAALNRIVAQGMLETAHRVYAELARVFDFAEARNLLPEDKKNPCAPLRRAFPAAPKKPIPSVHGERNIAALIRAIDVYEGMYSTRALLRLQMLVFTRPSEIRKARWCEFDLDAAKWIVPAARMKVKRNGSHEVPLARQAVEILRELRTIVHPNNPWVFPGRGVHRPLCENTVNVALTAIGFGRDSGHCHRAHGFRHLASTYLNELAASRNGQGFTPEHIEKQLAHKTGSVRDVYNQAAYWEQRRFMMQLWADEIDRMRALPLRAEPSSE